MLLKNFSKKDLFNLIAFTNNTLNVDSDEQFTALLNGIKIFIPFQYLICGLVKYHENKPIEVVTMKNLSYPQEWMDLYLKHNYFSVDPIVITHFNNFSPQIWNDTYQSVPNINNDFISRSNDFGLLNGVAFGINDKKSNLISLFSFANLFEKPSKRHLQFLKTLVPHLHQLLIRLSNEKKLLNKNNTFPKISAREKEVLAWLYEGKTNWETSMILNISERTVKFHVSNLIEKLDAVSRGHVVAKALEFGLM